jgi:hypothetical protein
MKIIEVAIRYCTLEATRGRRASTLGRRLAAHPLLPPGGRPRSPYGRREGQGSVVWDPAHDWRRGGPQESGNQRHRARHGGGKGTSLRELRDRAILLLGFSGAFRRSELVALNLTDIEWTTEGALVSIRRSKTDQEGLGRRVGIPRGDIACPVTALEAWLEAADISEGAVFRRIFNRRAQRVGIND